MSRVDLKIGWQCNNLCQFCVQGEKRKLVAAKELDILVKNLADSLNAVLRKWFDRRGTDLASAILGNCQTAKKIGLKPSRFKPTVECLITGIFV